jgi:hypothetical protein
MLAANRCRYSRGLKWQRLGSARVSRAGDGVSPSRTFPKTTQSLKISFQERLFRRDAETSTRADGISEIEGKAATGSGERVGKGASFRLRIDQ